MDAADLHAIVARGEDSHHQFKRDFTNTDALAAELIAFANTVGGRLLIGVTDEGRVSGLAGADVARLNQMLSNAAAQHVRPPLNPVSNNIQTDQGLVMMVDVAEGLNIKAVAFPGSVLHDSRYLDSEDIDGKLAEQYRRGMAFIKRNLRHVQGEQGFNSPGLLEVPEEVFEELLVNALVHRDYFISAPIRLLIFADRVEIISPGHLPNHLGIEQIRYGISNLRNPALASHAFHLLPYRGLGSGIPRATAAWPAIELIDERRANQFRAVIRRPSVEAASGESAVTDHSDAQPESRPDSQPESLEERVLQLLHSGPLGKAEISQALGQRAVSGQLNKTIRTLLAQDRIEMTRPETPQSRLQKYRLGARDEDNVS